MFIELSRRQFARSLACGLAGLSLLKPQRIRCASDGDATRGAVRFLVDAQSPDGAWRSKVRGVFRDGDALTPLVLRTLQDLPEKTRPHATMERGLRWMSNLTKKLQDSPEPWSGLRYPLFTACHAARLGMDAGSTQWWTDLLRRLQLSPANGWPDTDARSGGWSDAARPVRFTNTEELPDLNNPNLSATACALEGLEGVANDKVRHGALAFVMRCQNFRIDASFRDEVDDGGFFFTLDDPIRNKAGVTLTDADDHRRFRSYGSATCDGLLSLVACGLPPDHPRIQAAIRWLQRNAGESPHPGNWPPARRAGAAGLDFYFAQAYAKSLRWMDRSVPSLQAWCGEQRRLLTSSLLARQNTDGSWVNPEPESFEDDPLLATSFALRALTADNSV
ncbi:MAG: hypothetical protein K8R87_08095 [Verrucomicrobia bacterium]|nr:hypothetical protein [Verrucomicrobiota bacterium]